MAAEQAAATRLEAEAAAEAIRTKTAEEVQAKAVSSDGRVGKRSWIHGGGALWGKDPALGYSMGALLLPWC